MNKKRGNIKRISLGKDLAKPVLKIYSVGIVLIILFVVISVKAMMLQVFDRDRAVDLARRQHQSVYKLLPNRGKILDVNGKELVMNVDTQSIYVNAKSVKDPEGLSTKLSKHLGISRDKIMEILKSKKSFAWVKRLVDHDRATKIKAENLEAIGFIEEPKRVYPNGHLAGQIIGFTNIDSKGIEGIEFQFDEILAGKPGKISVKKDARGRKIMSTPYYLEPSVSGSNLILTIDSQIQNIVETELKDGVERANADKGMALVMDPETGSIMAMASYPFFDPNKYRDFSADTRRNLPIWYSYEPGSTMKVFLIASAIEDERVNPDSKFDCENGKRKVGPFIIKDVHPYGILTVSEIMEKSSNICATKIGEILGKEKFYEYLNDFGFGKQTGLELPGESYARLPNPKSWGQVELATISFGQGVAVTSLQLATTLSAIANTGYLMKPYIVKEIAGPDGKVLKENKPRMLNRVISYDTSKQITEMMEKVVESGTGKKASISGYSVAGKTGTAQVPNPETGGYYANRFISSFIGFAPSNDPKLTVVVVIENPKNGHYGGTVAAPIFKGITEKVLFYLGIPPNKEFVGTRVMPDLHGLSVRDILKWSETEGVKITIKGNGFVSAQEPKAGEIIKEGVVCMVEFKQTI